MDPDKADYTRLTSKAKAGEALRACAAGLAAFSPWHEETYAGEERLAKITDAALEEFLSVMTQQLREGDSSEGEAGSAATRNLRDAMDAERRHRAERAAELPVEPIRQAAEEAVAMLSGLLFDMEKWIGTADGAAQQVEKMKME